MTFTPRRVFIGAITLLIVGAIAASIWVAGSPAEARLRILDERRIQHLQSIEHWVALYTVAKKSLPPSLGLLSQPPIGMTIPVDPETGQAYEYRITGPRSYELCATFSREGERASPSYGPYAWTHVKGRQCFPRDVK